MPRSFSSAIQSEVAWREDVEDDVGTLVAQRERTPDVEHHTRCRGKCAQTHPHGVGGAIGEQDLDAQDRFSDDGGIVACPTAEIGDAERLTTVSGRANRIDERS